MDPEQNWIEVWIFSQVNFSFLHCWLTLGNMDID